MAESLARPALLAGLIALALVGMGVPGALPSSWTSWCRLATGIVLVPVGAWLAIRSRRRKAGRGWRARLVEPTLEILGAVMVTVGIIELVVGLRGVV